MPTDKPIAELFAWLDQSSDKPGMIRTADFLQRLEEWHSSGLALSLPNRVKSPSPGQVQLLQDLRTLLKGHVHIRFVPNDMGWRAGPVASQLVGMLDKYFFNVIKTSKDTAMRLAALKTVGYVQHIYLGESEAGVVTKSVSYMRATEACPAGLRYLDWMLNDACKQKGHRSMALRNRLETEENVWYAENLGKTTLRNELLEDFTTLVHGDDPNFDRVAVDSAGLDQAVQKEFAQWLERLQLSGSASKPMSGENAAVKRAFDARPAPHSTAWPWRGMHTGQQANGAGWPFPIRIAVNDRAKPEKLRREGEARLQLSAAFTHTDHYEVHSTSQQADEAMRAWQQLEDAGCTLQTLSMALVLLSQGLNSKRRCSVCQRHLGAMGDRTRCELHRADAGTAGTRSGKRTDIYRMDGWGAVAKQQWQALLADMTRSQAALDAARTVRHWWDEPLRFSAGKGTGNAVAIGLTMSALTERIDGMEAWIGKSVRDQLLALARHIEQQLLAAAKPTQGSATEAQDQFVKLIQHELSAQVFFGLYFAGYGAAAAPRDRWHPLAQMGPAVYLLNELLRDLLQQRAWVESGGMQMDMDRRQENRLPKDQKEFHVSVPPPPSQRKKQINAEKAIDMKRVGASYAEIARHFEVSPAAVTKFFQRIGKGPLQPKGEAAKPTKRS